MSRYELAALSACIGAMSGFLLAIVLGYLMTRNDH